MNMPDDNRELVERLLGPRQDEVGCDECFERLDEFVELELAGLDADRAVPGLRAHLEGCPACREEYEGLSELAAGSGPAARE